MRLVVLASLLTMLSTPLLADPKVDFEKKCGMCHTAGGVGRGTKKDVTGFKADEAARKWLNGETDRDGKKHPVKVSDEILKWLETTKK